MIRITLHALFSLFHEEAIDIVIHHCNYPTRTIKIISLCEHDYLYYSLDDQMVLQDDNGTFIASSEWTKLLNDLVLKELL